MPASIAMPTLLALFFLALALFAPRNGAPRGPRDPFQD
jgi:hypothetical protein